MHDEWVTYILGNSVSITLSVLAFLLVVLYLIDLLLINNGSKRAMRREGIAIRLINWFAFGLIFLFFGQIIPVKDIQTWRAAARLALLFLMLSEALFEIITIIPAIKRAPWKKEI
jgi:hypothetical protein